MPVTVLAMFTVTSTPTLITIYLGDTWMVYAMTMGTFVTASISMGTAYFYNYRRHCILTDSGVVVIHPTAHFP